MMKFFWGTEILLPEIDVRFYIYLPNSFVMGMMQLKVNFFSRVQLV